MTNAVVVCGPVETMSLCQDLPNPGFTQLHVQHLSFSDMTAKPIKKKDGVEETIDCMGCVIRRTGIGGDEDETSKHLTCRLCLAARLELDHFAQDFYAGNAYKSDREQKIYQLCPPWRRYRLKGAPDSAIRILSIKQQPADELVRFYSPNQTEYNDPDVESWITDFQLLLLNVALPKSLLQRNEARHKLSAPTPAALILEYADPITFYMLALRVDEQYQPGQSMDGLIIIPNLPPDKVEMVNGWSPSVIKILKQLPTAEAYLFCAPLGYIPMRNKIVKQFQKQQPTSSPSKTLKYFVFRCGSG